ncbi:beta-propeller fold lactonase family protein [Pseudomonas sp. LS1212]|nr:cytochrome D1 domain-containing protein [Pseudomonas sp. LS1212]UVJ46111.1 beta-propeller fold lactonase family protein [Pseudomonas sp. LS1212]
MNASIVKGPFVALLMGLFLAALLYWYEGQCDDVLPLITPVEPQQRLERDGVSIEFEARPVNGGALTEGMFADVRFRITDSASGQPLSGIAPGAWLDQAQAGELASARDKSCKSRVALYLKSSIGARPLLDLNSYYLLVLNKDASLTVIDPSVSVGGVTSTMARIALKQAPMDWVAGADDKRVFVSMPTAGEVAVIDAEKFQLLANLSAGSEPVRVALQPDERLLWVGNNARDEARSGVTIIDTQSLKTLKYLATGKGHHEIAFSKDSRYAFVSNRDSGTLSVIDVATLEVQQQLHTGSHPLSVAYSPLSQAVYVADGKDGTITVVDAASLQVRKVIKGQRGLGPMRFSEDGRFGIVLNTLENRAQVIDAASDEVIHSLEVSPEPFQLTFTKAYAYIRGLASPRVTMINLSTLGKDRQPILQGFEAGPAAPRLAGDLPLAPGLSPSRDDNSVFVVNPVDNTTYFYAEGMNAPMSGYPNRGHTARAAMVIDRSLREVEPGVYSSRVKMPVAGRFDVAFLLNQPQIVHCFNTEIEVNPALEKALATPRLEFLMDKVSAPLGSPFNVRLRVVEGRSGHPRKGLKDLQLRYYLAPSSRPQEVLTKEVADGIYEAALDLPQVGAYYLHARSATLGAAFDQQTYTSLRVLPGNPVKVPTGKTEP